MKPFLTILFLLLHCQGAFIGQPPGISLKQRNEKILEVRYDHGGGDAGFFMTVKITKDSIFYDATTDYSAPLGKFPEVIKRQRSSANDWPNLTASINLATFDKIKSGPNLRRTDGTDIQLVIKTTKRDHFLVVDKNNHPQVKGIMDRFQVAVNRFNKKAKIFD